MIKEEKHLDRTCMIGSFRSPLAHRTFVLKRRRRIQGVRYKEDYFSATAHLRRRWHLSSIFGGFAGSC